MDFLTGDDAVDIDECAVNNAGCSPVATCSNNPGSFTCTCPPGYTANVIDNTLSCTGKWICIFLFWLISHRVILVVGNTDRNAYRNLAVTVIVNRVYGNNLYKLPSSFRQPHSVHCNPGSPHPAHITSSQSPPSLPSPITASTFHSRLKTRLFHKSFPP